MGVDLKMRRRVRRLTLRPQNLSGPLLDLDFVNGLYWGGGAGAATFATLPGVVVTRASTAYAENEAGLYSSFASGVPRVTNKGLLAETAATNHIRNNSNTGAVVGAPGTMPTNWTLTLPTGLSREVLFVGTDTATGLPRIRVKISGTVTVASSMVLAFDNNTQIAAADAQPWCLSCWVGLVAGAVPTTGRMEILLRDAGGSTLGQLVQTSLTGLVLEAAPTRLSAAATIANASTAFAQMRFAWNTMSIGTVVDVTFDIMGPQAEQALAPSSPILTTTAAATRSADLAHVTLPTAISSAPVTVMFEGEIEVVDDLSIRYLGAITDGTAANRLRIARNDAAEVMIRCDAGGVASVFARNVSSKGGARVLKAASGWDGTTTYLHAVDGVAATQSVAAGPVSLTRLELGQLSTVNQLNGWVRKARVWRRALSQTELNTVTT